MGIVKYLALVFNAIKFHAWYWAVINQWNATEVIGVTDTLFEAHVPYFASSAANLLY